MLNQSNPQLIRRQQVELMTGLKRSSIYGRMNPQCKQYDPDFPKPVSLSTGGKGSVADCFRSECVDRRPYCGKPIQWQALN
jgi:prophage regulatory protein